MVDYKTETSIGSSVTITDDNETDRNESMTIPNRACLMLLVVLIYVASSILGYILVLFLTALFLLFGFLPNFVEIELHTAVPKEPTLNIDKQLEFYVCSQLSCCFIIVKNKAT